MLDVQSLSARSVSTDRFETHSNASSYGLYGYIFSLQGVLNHVVDTGKLNQPGVQQSTDLLAHKYFNLLHLQSENIIPNVPSSLCVLLVTRCKWRYFALRSQVRGILIFNNFDSIRPKSPNRHAKST